MQDVELGGVEKQNCGGVGLTRRSDNRQGALKEGPIVVPSSCNWESCGFSGQDGRYSFPVRGQEYESVTMLSQHQQGSMPNGRRFGHVNVIWMYSVAVLAGKGGMGRVLSGRVLKWGS